MTTEDDKRVENGVQEFATVKELEEERFRRLDKVRADNCAAWQALQEGILRANDTLEAHRSRVRRGISALELELREREAGFNRSVRMLKMMYHKQTSAASERRREIGRWFEAEKMKLS